MADWRVSGCFERFYYFIRIFEYFLLAEFPIQKGLGIEKTTVDGARRRLMSMKPRLVNHQERLWSSESVLLLPASTSFQAC